MSTNDINSGIMDNWEQVISGGSLLVALISTCASLVSASAAKKSATSADESIRLSEKLFVRQHSAKLVPTVRVSHPRDTEGKIKVDISVLNEGMSPALHPAFRLFFHEKNVATPFQPLSKYIDDHQGLMHSPDRIDPGEFRLASPFIDSLDWGQAEWQRITLHLGWLDGVGRQTCTYEFMARQYGNNSIPIQIPLRRWQTNQESFVDAPDAVWLNSVVPDDHDLDDDSTGTLIWRIQDQ